jgi:hypothetical protein
MVLKPSLSLLAGVLGVIVLLEDDITCIFAKVVEAFLKVLLQDLDVEVPIHPPINPSCIPNSIPQHAAPDHHRSSSKLLSPLNQPITQALPCLFPDPLPPIWPQPVDFSFIRPHHLLLILHSPMLVCQGKVHPCLSMPLGEEGLFLLCHSLQASCFEATTHSLHREGLVGDIPKCFGNIHSSISLPRADKTLCMTDVGWGKLGRTTTKRLREVRAMFRMKLRHCTKAILGSSCYLGGCMASIKQSKDMVLVSSWQSMHGGKWGLISG